jgi:hypothetical protein
MARSNLSIPELSSALDSGVGLETKLSSIASFLRTRFVCRIQAPARDAMSYPDAGSWRRELQHISKNK